MIDDGYMTKTEALDIAHFVANKMKMPYCWQNIYDRIYCGLPLPIILEDKKKLRCEKCGK